TAVATIAEAASILALEVPNLLATDVVLIDGSSTSLAKQAEAAGAKTLMMTGSPDRIVEFDGAGQPYLSRPFQPEAFLERVRQILIPEARGVAQDGGGYKAVAQQLLKPARRPPARRLPGWQGLRV